MIDRLLHPRLRNGSLEERTLGRVVLWVSVAGVLGLVVLLLDALSTGRLFAVGFRTFMLALFLPLIVIVVRAGSLVALSRYATFATWTFVTFNAVLTGGALSRGLYLYAMVPFLAATVGGRRLATAGLALSLASVAALYLLEAAGVALPRHGIHARVLDFPSLVVASALVFGVTALTVRSRRAVWRQVEGAVLAVAAANDRAAAARARLERAQASNQAVLGRVGDGLYGSLAQLTPLAAAVAAAMPRALGEHGRMLVRGAEDLLTRLEAFVAYARQPPEGGAGAGAPLRDGGLACAPDTGPPASELAPGWRRIDRLLPRDVVSGEVDRRAHARLVVAVMLAIVGFGVAVAAVDALSGRPLPLVGLGAAAVSGSLLLVVRRRAGIPVAVAVVTGLLVVIGAGHFAVRPEPGDPSTAWILLIGLLPGFYGSFVVPALALGTALVLAALQAGPVPAEPSVTPLSDVLGLCVAMWAVVLALLDLHAVALAELRAELRARQAQEAQLEVATRALTAEAHAHEQFLTGVSHELRSPLNGVLGVAELLSLEADTAPVRVELAALQRAGRAVVRAVDTLLCLARTHAMGVEAPYLIDLPGMVEAAAAKGEHAAPGQRVTTRTAPACPRVVCGAVGPLRVLLDQVVGSALEAGGAHLELEAGWEPAGLVVTLAGDGVSAALLTQGTAMTLGLSLAEALAEAVGGSCTGGLAGDGRWRATLRLPATSGGCA